MTPLLGGRLSHLQRRVINHCTGLTRTSPRKNLKQRIHPFVRARGPSLCLFLLPLLCSFLFLGRESLGGILLRVYSILDMSELTFIAVSAASLGEETARLLLAGISSALAFTSLASLVLALGIPSASTATLAATRRRATGSVLVLSR